VILGMNIGTILKVAEVSMGKKKGIYHDPPFNIGMKMKIKVLLKMMTM